MLYGIGILLGILTAVLKGIDTVMNKSLMDDETSAIAHSLYRILFVTPILFVAALLHWTLSVKAIWWIVLYGLLEAANILLHQYAIKLIQPVYAELLSKSKALTTYLLSLILVIESVSVKGVLGVCVFMIGMFVTIDFKALKKEQYTSAKGYLSEIGSVLARTMKPFVLARLLLSGEVSNEVLALLSMPIAFVAIWITFRPKLPIKEIPKRKYFAQAIVVGASMLTMGYAVVYAGAVLTAMTEHFSVWVVGFLMFVFYKQVIPKRVWFGSMLAILGVILVSLSS